MNYKDECPLSGKEMDDVFKTGKHYDIQAILDGLKEDS